VNLFNNQIPISRSTVWSVYPPDGYPVSIFDPNQPQTNPYYGYVTSRQEPRQVRAALKIWF
jgi:hypothetical protein